MSGAPKVFRILSLGQHVPSYVINWQGYNSLCFFSTKAGWNSIIWTCLICRPIWSLDGVRLIPKMATGGTPGFSVEVSGASIRFPLGLGLDGSIQWLAAVLLPAKLMDLARGEVGCPPTLKKKSKKQNVVGVCWFAREGRNPASTHSASG